MLKESYRKSNLFLVFIKTFLFCLALASLILIIFYGWRIYQNNYHENISLEKNKNIKPKEAFEINFSVPLWKKDYINKIKIIPEEEIELNLDQSKRKLIITPKKFWQPGGNYFLILPEGRTAMLTKILEKKIAISIVDFPQIKAVFPVDGEKDVVIGAEDPIVINFDHSVDGFYLNFKLNSDNEINYQINSEKNQFKILPKNEIEDGTQYILQIFSKIQGESDKDYRLIYSETFETLKTTPIIWEKDYALRLVQAKKYTKARIMEGKYIDINLTTQIMTTFENGALLDAYLISSGKAGMETPIGNHQIYNKAPRAYSKSYGLYMPNWMAILADGKMGIHELPEWPGGYKEGANHLGTPVSHGCVRLGVGPAKTVYDWAEIGTPVIVY